MALIVEDGSVVLGADSYLDVADPGFANFGHSAWAAETDTAKKEVALRLATEYLDTAYVWKGYKTKSTHSLAWPRTSVIVQDGTRTIGGNELPRELTRALMEIAADTLVNGDPSLPTDRGGAIKRRREKTEGVFEEETEYMDAAPTGRRFPRVDRLLSDFSVSGAGSPFTKLVRA